MPDQHDGGPDAPSDDRAREQRPTPTQCGGGEQGPQSLGQRVARESSKQRDGWGAQPDERRHHHHEKPMLGHVGLQQKVR